MKVIDLLNKIANGEEVPKKIKYKDYLYEYVHDDRDYVEPKKWTYLFYDVLVQEKGFDFYIKLNDEVEIIEEKKKFTKEDFINERMGIDKITRKEFDEMYEVKECNCGMPYCKGFIAVDKEEPQEHKIPEKLPYYSLEKIQKAKNKDEWREERISLLEKRVDDYHNKINEILDYLEEIE